jgi:hypothetical protein
MHVCLQQNRLGPIHNTQHMTQHPHTRDTHAPQCTQPVVESHPHSLKPVRSGVRLAPGGAGLDFVSASKDVLGEGREVVEVVTVGRGVRVWLHWGGRGPFYSCAQGGCVALHQIKLAAQQPRPTTRPPTDPTTH